MKTFIIILAFLTFSFRPEFTNDYVRQLEINHSQSLATIDILNNNLQESYCKIDSMGSKIDSLTDSKLLVEALMHLKSRSQIFKESSAQGFYIGSKVKIRSYGVNPYIRKELYAALLELDNSITITSAYRPNNSKSYHAYGKAVDVRLDDEGMEFFKWLITPEGFAWREKHNIRFMFELHNRELLKNYSGKVFKPYLFYNRKATGPHIHLELIT